jgi:hypothetical protein
MAIRQDMKARLRKYVNQVNRMGPSNYTDRFSQEAHKRYINGDGEVEVLKTVAMKGIQEVAVLAKVERGNALRITVEDPDTHFEYSRLYFAPLQETEKEYFISYGSRVHEGKVYEVVAADLFKTVGFDIWNKWYLLKPDDFGLRDELIFCGVAELASMNGNAFELEFKGMRVDDLKRDFEPVNKFYATQDANGVKKRRNVFLLPTDE